MPANRFIYAMLTDRGRVRDANEDTCAAAPDAGAYVVCDGMGGAAAGDIASRLAANTFLGHLRSEPQGIPPPEALNQAIEAANHAVYEQSIRMPQLSGMGTTLVALLHAPLRSGSNGSTAPARRSASNHLNSRITDPPTLWLGHVGDSRCYRRRKGQLEQLTQDHSVVEEQLRAGQITPAQAASSPMRNLITRAIGSQPTVEVEIQSHRPQENDLYLLASDGLTHELRDEDISQILASAPLPHTCSSLKTLCEDLIHAANESGGNDNITVLLVAVTP